MLTYWQIHAMHSVQPMLGSAYIYILAIFHKNSEDSLKMANRGNLFETFGILKYPDFVVNTIRSGSWTSSAAVMNKPGLIIKEARQRESYCLNRGRIITRSLFWFIDFLASIYILHPHRMVDGDDSYMP